MALVFTCNDFTCFDSYTCYPVCKIARNHNEHCDGTLFVHLWKLHISKLCFTSNMFQRDINGEGKCWCKTSSFTGRMTGI